MARVSTVMKPCRNMREGKTGKAMKGHCPRANRVTYSEADISEASNSSLATMRSNSSRGSLMATKLRSIPSARTSPV
jgi:hypothetical protein